MIMHKISFDLQVEGEGGHKNLAAPKMCLFLQLAAEKKTPFLVQQEQFSVLFICDGFNQRQIWIIPSSVMNVKAQLRNALDSMIWLISHLINNPGIQKNSIIFQRQSYFG